MDFLQMKRVASSREESSFDIDIINTLPEPLICLIISKLPFNESVATSIICRRWRFLWKWVPRLKLDPRLIKPWRGGQRLMAGQVDPLKSQKESRMNEIDEKLVSSLPNGNVTVCQIFHFPGCGVFKFLAKQDRLEELSLHCLISRKCQRSEIPLHNSQVVKLSLLKLSSYNITDASMFVGCVNLKTLTLMNVVLSDDDVTIGEILHCCPNLEKLALELLMTSNSHRTEFFIQSRKLKFLKIENMDTSDIWAGNIRPGIFRAVGDKNKNLIIDCPILEELSLHHPTDGHVRQVLLRNSGLVQETEDVCSMKELRVLSATLDLNNEKDINVLSHILDVWTNLQKIDITSKVDGSVTREYWNVWGKKEFSSKLRVVNIRRFRGTKAEIMFASLIIKKAAGLKQLVIGYEDKCSKKGAADGVSLLSIQPRASNDVSIILKPGKVYMAKYGSNFLRWMTTLPLSEPHFV